MVRSQRFAALAAGLAVAVGIAAWALAGESDRPALGLFTSLPIYRAETASVAEAIDTAAQRHWVRTALEKDYHLQPLDALDPPVLARLRNLLLAQPRPLAPAENVALDDWVRRGGRLLLFADPFLTEPSRFPLGDRRRPQDVVLVSPILKHWGLELRFDEDQPDGEHAARLGTLVVPVHLAGHLVAPQGSPCAVADGGLTAECPVGTGRVLVVADAAMLEGERPEQAAALDAVATRAFGHD